MKNKLHIIYILLSIVTVCIVLYLDFQSICQHLDVFGTMVSANIVLFLAIVFIR